MSFSSPEELNKLAKEFEEASLDENEIEITTDVPPSNIVELPGGFILSSGELAKFVEVRELNGADEEELSKATTPNRLLQVVFSRGLVSLEDAPAYSEDLDTMLSGDRDAVVLGIRCATFGKDLTYNATCPACLDENEITIDLVKDVKTRTLNDPVVDRTFKVSTKNGEAVVTLPNGVTNKKLLDADSKTTSELMTIVLSGCIVSINGTPSLGVQTALNLGILDRETIISEIYKRTPGPRLGEVKKACKACGNEIPLPLSLASLFRI
jgi:hypothetical protein